MLPSLSRRILGLVLLPLLLLLGGVGPGNWHCADGSLCETHPRVACCCGCDEGDFLALVIQACKADHHLPQVAVGECGCYYAAQKVAVHPLFRPEPVVHVATLPPDGFLLPIPTAHTVLFSLPSATGSLPRHLVSPRDTRAPPLA